MATHNFAQSTEHRAQSTEPSYCVKFEEYERDRLDEIYDDIAPYSGMCKNERYFLNGIIRYFRPHKVLEVGVDHGGGTAIILNAIRDIDGAELISEDYCEKHYSGIIDKLSGHLVDEKFSHLKDKWTIYRGGDISRYIEKIGGNIDLLVLDTAHIHPWETLNFLCVLPFMKKDSWCVLHDISLPMIKGRENDLACRYLYGHVVSDAKIMPVSDYDSYFANIGAFRVTDDTVKYAGNLFESLLDPWEAMPGVFDKNIFPHATPMLPEDLSDIKHIIDKYYPERSTFFDETIRTQKEIIKHRTEVYKSWRATWLRLWPSSFHTVKSIRNAILRR